MGSGKTTLGKELARLMALEFIDLDKVITLKTGESINNTFERKGENYFRQIEKETLLEILRKESFLMAVGGGTPCFYDNMELMNQNGLTIYLKLTATDLYSRLAGRTSHRPLLKGYGKKELLKYITETLGKREPSYLQSQMIIEESEQIPDIVLKKINNYRKSKGLA